MVSPTKNVTRFGNVTLNNFVNQGKWCLFDLTLVFGLENGRSVGTGQVGQDLPKFRRLDQNCNHNKQEIAGEWKIQSWKGEVLTLRENQNPNAHKYYKLGLHGRGDALDIDSLKVTNRNTKEPCENVTRGSPLMDRT